MSRTCLIKAACLAAVGLLGCSDHQEALPGVSVRDSAGVTIVTISRRVEDLPAWAISDEPLFSISGDAPPFLGTVGEVAFLGDGRLLVEDQLTDELRIFEASGGYELVGGAGEGPGEFSNLTKLTVTSGDTFYAFDRRLLRMSGFDPQGQVVTTTPVAREEGGLGTIPLDMWAFDSDHLVLHRMSPYDTTNAAPLPRRDQRDALLTLLDRAGEDRGPMLRFKGGYSVEFDMGDAGPPFGNVVTIAVAGGRLLYTSGIDYDLTVTDPDLEPLRIIRWPGWRRPLGEEELREVRDTTEAGLEEIRTARPDVATSIMNALFSPNTLPDTLPALGPVLLSESGDIWVAAFAPSIELWEQESRWHVLSPEGRPLARITLPANSRLAAVRDSLVAIVVRDSLDVESVQVHAIRGR